jgi:hypothetical protein
MRVNCIAPSLLDTDLARQILASETIANAISSYTHYSALGQPRTSLR